MDFINNTSSPYWAFWFVHKNINFDVVILCHIVSLPAEEDSNFPDPALFMIWPNVADTRKC